MEGQGREREREGKERKGKESVLLTLDQGFMTLHHEILQGAYDPRVDFYALKVASGPLIEGLYARDELKQRSSCFHRPFKLSPALPSAHHVFRPNTPE